MRAEGPQITTLWYLWHVTQYTKPDCMCIHFIFLRLQVHFPDVERVEWLNKVRSSELRSVRLCALSWIPAWTLSLRKLVNYNYNKVQSQRCQYLSFWASRVVTGLGESQMFVPGWCRCDEFDHTTSSWDSKTKIARAHVCTCMCVCVCGCIVILAKAVVFISFCQRCSLSRWKWELPLELGSGIQSKTAQLTT